ncbi:hypothetical protein BHE74_00047174 [Ensete ventricosum]|nr:hypothetical protein GW17_00048496 [Ensete ventricosum]RWW46870.1 hypothetical protein BHE74_00047174 [Ensete ventricosum]RZR91521.1 hypothetical protein BHM03_00019641 [Ensete ventricosum]
MNEKVSWTLESLKLLHDFESVVTEELLGHVRKRYSIPPNYEMHAPRLRQCTYNLFSNGFGLTLDALKKANESTRTSWGASRGEGSIVGSVCKGRVPLSGVDSSAKVTWPGSIRDLCQMRARVKYEPFQALFMVDQSEGELGAPLEPRSSSLTIENRVWSYSSSVAAYERGALCPVLLKQLHGSTSKMLIEKVTYEYEYWVALARLRARYHDLEIEEDPFANLPEDDNVEMLNEVPFDDSPDPPSV